MTVDTNRERRTDTRRVPARSKGFSCGVSIGCLTSRVSPLAAEEYSPADSVDKMPPPSLPDARDATTSPSFNRD